MDKQLQAVCAEVVGPVVELARHVGYLYGYPVLVCPTCRETEKTAQRPCCAEECVESCFGRQVVGSPEQAKGGVLM